MRHTFDNPKTMVKSACFAFALTFAVFSVLPASKSAFEKVSDSTHSKVPTRVNLTEFNVPKSLANLNNAPKVSPMPSPIPVPDIPLSLPNVNLAVSDLSISSGNLSNFAAEGALFAISSEPATGNSVEVFEAGALDSIPRKIAGAPPKYPERLLRRGIEGDVRLRVILDENGNVEIESVEFATDPMFADSAIAAAKKFRYEIPRKDGRPARVRFILPVPFRIERQ